MGCTGSRADAVSPVKIAVGPSSRQDFPASRIGTLPQEGKDGHLFELSLGCAGNADKTGGVSLGSRSTSSGGARRRMVETPKDYYRFQERLGAGASGYVVRAQSRYGQDTCAIKCMPTKIVDTFELSMEADILGMMNHPNVVRLIECLEDDSKTYMVMEVCDGGELLRKVEFTDGLPEREVAIVMRQVLSVISYMHSLRICHRDVKPENFLLAKKASLEDTMIKAVDFGLACIFHRGVPMTATVGTSYYIAPEVLQGSYSASCDLWSCGCLMYLLCSGILPFQGESDDEVLRKVAKGKYWFPSRRWERMSQAPRALVAKLLMIGPANRHTAEAAASLPWFDHVAPRQPGLASGPLAMPLLRHSTNSTLSFPDTEELAVDRQSATQIGGRSVGRTPNRQASSHASAREGETSLVSCFAAFDDPVLAPGGDPLPDTPARPPSRSHVPGDSCPQPAVAPPDLAPSRPPSAQPPPRAADQSASRPPSRGFGFASLRVPSRQGGRRNRQTATAVPSAGAAPPSPASIQAEDFGTNATTIVSAIDDDDEFEDETRVFRGGAPHPASAARVGGANATRDDLEVVDVLDVLQVGSSSPSAPTSPLSMACKSVGSLS